jgi:hypothetical protein
LKRLMMFIQQILPCITASHHSASLISENNFSTLKYGSILALFR